MAAIVEGLRLPDSKKASHAQAEVSGVDADP
jgi:hypothetical protein